MIRVPFSKIYRAFPELDSFPDSECERFVVAARTQRGDQISTLTALSFVGALVGYGLMLFVIGSWLPKAWQRLMGRTLTSGDVEIVGAGIVLVVGGVSSWLAAMCARDRVLRSAILDRINLARCTTCKFSLLGLPAHGGRTRCPECGEVIFLVAIGLTETDLLTPREQALAAARVAAGSPALETASDPAPCHTSEARKVSLELGELPGDRSAEDRSTGGGNAANA